MKMKILALFLAIAAMGLAPMQTSATAPVCKSGFVQQGTKCVKKAAPKPSAPAVSCAIKGNVSAKKEKIYHVPGCPNYGQTKIDTPGEKMFCTEKEAMGAGWRKALNCPR
jgi:hypothetical protein